MVRVLIVDDQALVRRGSRMILDAEPDVHVVGEAATGLEAVEESARSPAGRRAHGHPDARPRRHRGHQEHHGGRNQVVQAVSLGDRLTHRMDILRAITVE